MITPEMEADGVVWERETATGWVYVVRMLYNHRLTFGPEYGCGYYEDCWCYADAEGAIDAAKVWDPEVSEEPVGWIKHPESGRARGEWFCAGCGVEKREASAGYVCGDCGYPLRVGGQPSGR